MSGLCENAPADQNCCALCHEGWGKQHPFRSPELKSTWGILQAPDPPRTLSNKGTLRHINHRHSYLKEVGGKGGRLYLYSKPSLKSQKAVGQWQWQWDSGRPELQSWYPSITFKPCLKKKKKKKTKKKKIYVHVNCEIYGNARSMRLETRQAWVHILSLFFTSCAGSFLI